MVRGGGGGGRSADVFIHVLTSEQLTDSCPMLTMKECEEDKGKERERA